MIEEIRCQHCGKLSYKTGGKEFISNHHTKGRNQPDSENEKEKLPLCNDCHDISECRNWLELPFTEYKIQGRLFDKYVKNPDIEYILKLIKGNKYLGLWRKI